MMRLFSSDSGLEMFSSVRMEAPIDKVLEVLTDADSYPDVFADCDRVVKLDESGKPDATQRIGPVKPDTRLVYHETMVVSCPLQ